MFAEKSYPADEAWALDWVDDIANLYHINNQRITYQKESKEFEKHDDDLRKAADDMKEKFTKQLSDDAIKPARKYILASLERHWAGLTVFVVHSFIPMDNNTAESGLRPGVLARKAFFGSRAIWSAQLLVLLMSIFQTMEQWGMNVHRWLDTYLTACARNGGHSPKNIDKFLPWKMSKRRLKEFQQPIAYEDSS